MSEKTEECKIIFQRIYCGDLDPCILHNCTVDDCYCSGDLDE